MERTLSNKNNFNKQYQRNNISRLLRISNRNRNALRWGSNETDEHITMKFNICKTLKEWGHEFYTEAIFDDTGLRADVIDADEGIVYEVVSSEEKESIERKKSLYPLEVRVIDADQEFTPKLLL